MPKFEGLVRILYTPCPQDCLQSNRLSLDESSVIPYMARTYLALHEGEWQVAEKAVNQTLVSTLYRWWQLPEVGYAPQVRLRIRILCSMYAQVWNSTCSAAAG